MTRKKMKTKRVRKFQPAKQKEFELVCYEEQTDKCIARLVGSIQN